MSSSLRTRSWIWGVIALVAVMVAGAVVAVVTVSANATGAQDEAPQSALHADTRMGAVELKVRDVAAMAAYYGENGVGLEVLSEIADAMVLGVDGEEVIRLTTGGGDPPSPTDAGLYHSAIVFPDGPALAEALVRVATQYPGLFQGASDHSVSEAFYFADPEGNGVELYIDTPRDEWVWQEGQVVMGSAPLDANAFIQEHLGGASAGDATMGHVHLKVGDIDQAREFYVDTLGFAATAEVNSALFMSAGGYHHHVAANTWGSAGAGARPEGLGLGQFTVVLPAASELDAVVERLQMAGLPFEQTERGVVVADPWGNEVHLTVE
ncbi:VOC family protein [Ruicaihuangia caeni]|uniref:VOC family protein n=1 Tax=Ruicaihuangia caeni TaxID=3042517 RepID=UPI00338FDEEB